MQKFALPTGILFTEEYSKGQLETLSIGDYGKAANVKADFLGYTRPLNGVARQNCMPLSEKWVITLSTQYGCKMKCNFCDVPNVPWRGNATVDDLKYQLFHAIGCYPDVRYTERLNIHFARMGEPIFNGAVFDFARWLYASKQVLRDGLALAVETLHPVLTTSMPAGYPRVAQRLNEWCDIKNRIYNGQAGLQLSINSTNDEQRTKMFNGMALSLQEISAMTATLPPPLGRKYCLNFAFSTDFEIDAKRLAQLFSPSKFMVKITPIHNNTACSKNGIQTVNGYNSYAPYASVEADLIRAGFDVLVFVPSMDEENNLVTCGNAILGGSTFKNDTQNSGGSNE